MTFLLLLRLFFKTKVFFYYFPYMSCVSCLSSFDVAFFADLFLFPLISFLHICLRLLLSVLKLWSLGVLRLSCAGFVVPIISLQSAVRYFRRSRRYLLWVHIHAIVRSTVAFYRFFSGLQFSRRDTCLQTHQHSRRVSFSLEESCPLDFRHNFGQKTGDQRTVSCLSSQIPSQRRPTVTQW